MIRKIDTLLNVVFMEQINFELIYVSTNRCSRVSTARFIFTNLLYEFNIPSLPSTFFPPFYHLIFTLWVSSVDPLPLTKYWGEDIMLFYHFYFIFRQSSYRKSQKDIKILRMYWYWQTCSCNDIKCYEMPVTTKMQFRNIKSLVFWLK